jgi:hypothetical protein
MRLPSPQDRRYCQCGRRRSELPQPATYVVHQLSITIVQDNIDDTHLTLISTVLSQDAYTHCLDAFKKPWSVRSQHLGQRSHDTFLDDDE